MIPIGGTQKPATMSPTDVTSVIQNVAPFRYASLLDMA
jgi:hypothetical protein